MLEQLRGMGKTHMPFVAHSPAGTVLLFCCHKRTWKAHARLPNGKVIRLKTRMPADATECSPSAWYDDGWHLSLIVGGSKAGPRFGLYQYHCATLENLGKPTFIGHANSGFVYKDTHVRGESRDLVFVHQSTRDWAIEMSGATIYRVSYRSDEPSKFLITGSWSETRIFTIEYDTKTEQQRVITTDGKPAYKCTIDGDLVLYADRLGKEFEDRKIVKAGVVEYRLVNYATAHR